MKAVLDTNVLVSALMNPHGSPARVVDLVLDGQLTAIVDDRILDEYETVLRRPKFPFASWEVDVLMDFFRHLAERAASKPLAVKIVDPTDAPFLEVALAGHADALITGNIRHFPRHASSPIGVLTPAQFLAYFSHQKSKKI